MMKLVIDRDRWLRGEGSSNSFLHRKSDGRMCCLGFLSVACGVPPGEITGIGQLSDLDHVFRLHDNISVNRALSEEDRVLLRLFDDHTFEERLINTNDNAGILDASREQRLTDLFKDELGIELEFV